MKHAKIRLFHELFILLCHTNTKLCVSENAIVLYVKSLNREKKQLKLEIIQN